MYLLHWQAIRWNFGFTFELSELINVVEGYYYIQTITFAQHALSAEINSLELD